MFTCSGEHSPLLQFPGPCMESYKQGIVRICLALTLLVNLSGCVKQQAIQIDTVAQEKQTHSPSHSWSRDEIAILRGLWIETLPTAPAGKSNRVAHKPAAVRLGKKIFFDPRFSANQKVACATCHIPDKYFTDGLVVGKGLAATTRNTPTIVGAAYNHWFFLDGRSDSLWSQALGPMENPLEHGGNRNQYAHIVFNDPGLREPYEQLFGPLPDLSDTTRFPLQAGPVEDPQANSNWQTMNEQDRATITGIFVNIGKLIAAYETQIKPAASRFDLYVKAVLDGDLEKMQQSLSVLETAGLRLFIGKARCTLCHNGPLFSDSEFHNIGTVLISDKSRDWGRYKGAEQIVKSEFNCRSDYNDDPDKSCPELKYIVKEKEHTISAFKTPGLRNVAKTAPYMHAGKYGTLSEVLNHYNNPPRQAIGKRELLNISLNKNELAQLQAFLLTLNSTVITP